MYKQRLIIVTTVPETLLTILKNQPRYLSNIFSVILITSPTDEIEELAQEEGVKVLTVPMARNINPIKDVTALLKMAVLLLQFRPDLVHSYTPKAGIVTMLAGWICRVPKRVHSFTGLIFPYKQGAMQKLLIMIDRIICACATSIIAEGEGVKNDLKTYSVTGKPLKVIGHGNIAGVNTEYYSPSIEELRVKAADLRSRLMIAGGAFVFCFLGRLNRDKGIRELICAFSALTTDAHLIIVGAMDRSAPIDIGTKKLLYRHPRVHMLGFCKDVRPVLLSADTLVLPSYREGFPNVVLQAGAMCLPVIATNISGSNEVIEEKFNGWLVPVRDAKALRNSMLAATMAPKDELIAMGERARKAIKDRFEQHDHWKRLIDYYMRLEE